MRKIEGYSPVLTTQGGVVLRKNAITLSRYRKHIIDDTKRIAKNHVQQALERSAQVTNKACEEGYKSGLLLLLSDFTQTLEKSLQNYQAQVIESQNNLIALMDGIFDDNRIKEIIAEHFSTLAPKDSKAILYVPVSLIEKIKHRLSAMEHIMVVPSDLNVISLKIDETIIQVAPGMIPKKISSDIFSPAEKCALIVEKITHYKTLSQIISQGVESHENRK